MQDTQLDLLQEAARPRRLHFVETEEGTLALRPRGRARGKACKIAVRRQQDWLLLEHPVDASISLAGALALQSSMVFAKYVLERPGGSLRVRADLSLAPEVVGHGARLRALLGAAVAPDKPSRSAPLAPEQVELALRAGLAETGDLTDAEEGFDLKIGIGGGRRRSLAVRLSARQVRFSLPLLGREVQLDAGPLEIVASHLLGLNGSHLFARAGFAEGTFVAEVVLPSAHLTPAECRLAAGSLAAFAACERTLELLVADDRARQLYAAHHALDLPRPDETSGS